MKDKLVLWFYTKRLQYLRWRRGITQMSCTFAPGADTKSIKGRIGITRDLCKFVNRMNRSNTIAIGLD